MANPGDLIDIWVVEKPLGRGGMGSVYRCHNKSATRILAAIKVLDAAVRSAAGAEERFIREAEILFDLDHPAIVKVRNIRIDAEHPYLEMEFVEGESLEHRLRRGALPVDLALTLMSQIADAVAYMHNRRVYHRDIKPANVLIDPQGNARIVDFGLALETDRSRLTQQGMTFGTVSYAPPEWITPDDLKPQMWDLYACGVLFWEMLTGRVAFPVSGQGSMRQQAMQVMLSKQDHPPLDPGHRFEDDLRQLIGAMTHSTVTERVQTMAEVRDRIAPLKPVLTVNSGETLTPLMQQRDVNPPSTWDDVPEDTQGVPRAPEPTEDLDTYIRAPRRPVLWLVAAGVPLLLGAAALGVWRLTTPHLPVVAEAAPTTRPVVLTVTAPEDARLLLNGTPLVIENGAVTLPNVPTGELVVAWVQGEDCTTCLDGPCPDHCGTGSLVVPVSAGDGPLLTSATLPAPPNRQVVFPSLTTIDGLSTTVWVNGETVSPGSDGRLTASTAPGWADLQVDVGTCTADAAGCWPDCPAGCASWATRMEIPWDRDPAVVVPNLRPTPAVAPHAHHRNRNAFVTQRQFATWLADNPSFQADAARASGRADNDYLKGWTGATPPAPGAVLVNVSYAAAAAYCAGRGGLPTVDANLPEPDATAELLEYRQSGRAGVVLEPDGRIIPALPVSEANAWTGFRCAP